MEKLSDDILVEILTRIPATSVTRLKLTNKKWCALISHPLFVKAHGERLRTDMRAACLKVLKIDRLCFQRTVSASRPQSLSFEVFEGVSVDKAMNSLHDPISRFPPIKIQVAGSCDGLICFTQLSCLHHIISLWNPSTKEVRNLPNDPNGPNLGFSQWLSFGLGIGYDCQTGDYKVVRAVCSRNEQCVKQIVVDVFMLKTNAWRRIHDNPREKFRELPMPETNANTEFQGIGIIDGRLVVYTGYWKWSGIFEGWSMKEYGVKTSWAKLFSISGEIFPAPAKRVQVLSLRNGKILLGLDRNEIVLYDIADGSFQFLLDIGWSGFRYEFIVYVESFISPYSGQGTSG
ncbi:F-box protein CPR1-like isoform X2 [Punica granatum]|uniref:F-box protein CPR1-like isoform X2 n=1 Tax=Punica granatum TaxID=22663 RepID=A0A6P8CXN1_PUNGR|nr:F-box protein CPR1-like isoform X2 [Punica granatum]